jgi:hypothetical protein
MAQIYFEYPNGRQPRLVVAVPPQGWTPVPQLVSTLLAALGTSQILQPVTLAGAFSAFSGPVSCVSACRLVAGPGNSTLPAAAIQTQRRRVDGLGSAIVPATAAARELPSTLGDLLLASEAVTLRPPTQAAVVRNAGSAINAQLGQLYLAGSPTVTLTARRGQIPITIAKAASMAYPVTGTLVLTSDRLLFSNGLSRIAIPGTTLRHTTNNIYVNVLARTSGEFKLEVTFQAPSGGLVLTNGLITVRSDAFSVVGVALSIGAVLVLGAWWVRTGMRRRRQRLIDESGGEP